MVAVVVCFKVAWSDWGQESLRVSAETPGEEDEDGTPFTIPLKAALLGSSVLLCVPCLFHWRAETSCSNPFRSSSVEERSWADETDVRSGWKKHWRGNFLCWGPTTVIERFSSQNFISFISTRTWLRLGGDTRNRPPTGFFLIRWLRSHFLFSVCAVVLQPDSSWNSRHWKEQNQPVTTDLPNDRHPFVFTFTFFSQYN